MTTSEDFLPYINGVENLLRPFIEATEDFDRAEELLRDLGYAPPSQVLAFGELSSVANAVADAIGSLRDAIDADDQDELLQQLVKLLPEVGRVVQAINGFDTKIQQNFAGSPFLIQTDILAAIAGKLTDYLVVKYLEDYHPTVFAVLLIGGVVDLEDIEGAPTPFHAIYRRRSVKWDRLPLLLSDPIGSLKTNLDGEDELLYERLLYLLYRLGLAVGLLPIFDAPRPAILTALNHGANLSATDGVGELDILYFPVTADPTLGVGFEVYPLVDATSAKYTGLALAIRVGAEMEIPLTDAYQLEIKASANARDGLGVRFARDGDVSFISSLFSSPTELAAATTFGIRISIVPTELGPMRSLLALGAPGGTRFEIGSGSLSLGVEKLDTLNLFVEADLRDVLISLKAQEADGFISSILPAQGVDAPFNLGVGFSYARGLYFTGGSGLSIRLPQHLNVGPIVVQDLGIDANPKHDSLPATLTIGFSANLGPVSVTVEEVGVQAIVKIIPDRTGNLGPLDLSFSFKPPDGLGLSIDAPGVTGGGFLFHDPAQSLYAGAMQLSLSDQLTVTAFGLITTRIPNGSGYSLMIFITAEDFRPVPLGLGFTLLGIGGMLAVNRTFDQDVLRAGMRSDTLKTLLFPRDPVANAASIIQSLSSAFPARRGSYLFGVLARIGWFTPTLITFDLALILELGARNRLLVLGRISSLLPSADNDLVRINLDAVGVLDFDQDTASLDALLVDSRLAHNYALTGAAALRAGWGAGPDSGFVLAVGGFNPHFAPPAGVPPLARVAIALCSGNNPRLTCEAYLAITANTLQFGARAELYAEAASFSISGDLGFDVLVSRSPLHFIADFHAAVQLKAGSHNLFKVSVEGSLEGPRPLRLSGKASFEILWCDLSVRFDKTLISGEPPPLPPGIDVLGELLRAVSSAPAFTTRPPTGRGHGVALRRLAPGGGLVLDPLGRLAVSQDVVPLDTGRDIDTFGGAPVAGARRFALGLRLEQVDLSEVTAEKAPFVPAQFFAMSDDEKLASPSFESFDAGFVVGQETVRLDGHELVAAPVEYDEIVIDTLAAPVPPPQPTVYVLSAEELVLHSATGAAARAPVRRAGRGRFRTPGDPAVALAAPHWAIVPLEAGPAVAVAPAIRTWSEYQSALSALNRAGARFQLVPAREIAA